MRRVANVVALALLAGAGCEAGPLVIVESRLPPPALVRNVRWNGCVWPEVMETGKATMPKPCLPGRARAYFELTDDPGRAPWLGYQTTFEAVGDSATVRIVLTGEAREPDRSAPNAFGH